MLSKFRNKIEAGRYVTPRAKTGDRGGVLRVSVQREAGSAKAYYRQGEYYAEGLELAGTWGGLAAKRLGLEGEVDKRDFAALCDNRHPDGSTLTARTRSSRRCLFDLNFHVPKSVSVLHGLFGDDAILDAFQTAVSETMVAIEAEIRTRVRRGGRDETRTTGNLVYARFIHTTARPVHGIPDPHLHAHCCVFNATFDDHEGRIKAIELGEVYASLPFHEAAFHARLARALVRLGYDVSRTRTGWEISGVPDRVLKAFSRRTEQIETVARELGLTDARSKDRLGAMTRTGKRKDRSLEELRIEWRARLTDTERSALESVNRREVPVAGLDPDAARSAMAWAIEHCFERESVIPVSKLLASALRYGVGSVSVEELVRELPRQDLLLRERDGRHLATTRAILDEESRMLAFARSGRGRCPSLGRPESPPALGSLGPDQAAAVRHLLSSPDRVMIVRGAAGTGKTALMKTAIETIQANGQRVVTLAPSADASRGVLRESGFPNADTVAKFLVDERLQNEARGQVLWIDEAGLLGTRTLSALFRIAESLGARVILSGDIRQHGPVERGLPLRLLETDAGIVPAEVTTIRRQRGGYRDAVQSLAEGLTVDGFDRLTDLGWVIEAGDDVRDERLAEEYAANLKRGKSTLVVAPTHAEGRRVTAAIRRTLQSTGRLATDETVYIRLEGKNLTVADQKLPANYSMGDAVEFHTRVPGFKTNIRYTVHRVGRASVAVRDPTGRLSILPLQHAATMTVYSVHELALAVGDRVRLTKNGWSSGRTTRLDNGRLETVERLLDDGRIQLVSGIRIDPGFGHLDYGYAVTSHAAQGKTVDRVLLAISSLSFAASGREQFYVSASRGRERVTVFTDDAIALRRVIERTDPKVSATDLVRDDLPSLSVWRAWVSRRVDAVRRAAREARQALRGLSSLGSSVGSNFAVNRDEIPRRPA
jgi:conjugative relaxase-like TrwC/TraI family protein